MTAHRDPSTAASHDCDHHIVVRALEEHVAVVRQPLALARPHQDPHQRVGDVGVHLEQLSERDEDLLIAVELAVLGDHRQQLLDLVLDPLLRLRRAVEAAAKVLPVGGEFPRRPPALAADFANSKVKA